MKTGVKFSMWKLLFTTLVLSAVLSSYGYANDSDYVNLADKYLSEAKYAIPKAEGFEEKKHTLVELEKKMSALYERASEDASLSISDHMSLTTIDTTLEIVPMADLEPETCGLYLARINSGYDPTTEINPRLPPGARQIYNLISLACSIDIAGQPEDKTVSGQD